MEENGQKKSPKVSVLLYFVPLLTNPPPKAQCHPFIIFKTLHNHVFENDCLLSMYVCVERTCKVQLSLVIT